MKPIVTRLLSNFIVRMAILSIAALACRGVAADTTDLTGIAWLISKEATQQAVT